MKPILNAITLKRCKLFAMMVFIGCGTVMGHGVVASADWQTPIMSDYVKLPTFASYAAKPNILIVLDNSGSMNSLAYSDGYTGTPYNGTSRSFVVELERDDMEENPSGVMRDGTSSGNDLDFGTDYVGVRFQNVEIPKAATITSARIEFTAKYDIVSIATDLEIRAEASDNAPFLDVTDSYNISSRTMGSAAVAWTPGDWVAGTQYDTPDLTAMVQEIVDRSGWTAGNAMLFRVVNPGFPASLSGHREVQSREAGVGTAAVLHVTYIDQAAGTRYYGYFNPDFFYTHRSNVFYPEYKKVKYDPFNNSWQVKSLTGTISSISDSNIAPATAADGLWDGNWMNWVCMRRVDVLRKVLMGGKATSRVGTGNQQNQCEGQASSYGTFWKYFNSNNGPATSPYKGGYYYGTQGDGDLEVYNTDGLYKLDIQKNVTIEPEDFFQGNLAGVLQRIGDRARWGNMWFFNGNPTNGGFVQNPIDNGFSTNFLPSLQAQPCNTWTPLAETMYVATQYFAQQPVDSTLGYPSQSQMFNIDPDTTDKGSEKDPYWDKDEARYVPCAKSFVLLLTDGASTKDSAVPDGLADFDGDGKDETKCNEDTETNCNYASGGTDFLDDVALYARTTDLRSDLEGAQNILLYTVYAFDDNPNARSLLQDASRNGGFEDLNEDGKPNGTYSDPPADRLEWDRDADGVPDTYFEATDGYTLEAQLLAAINDILKRASSGTAASVVSNSRSGEGAVYQSIFYPATTAGANTVKWVGQVHSLLSDAMGNIREDTNGNKKLDLEDDLFLVFGDTTVEKYKDIKGDGSFDEEDKLAGAVESGGTTEFAISDINYLWSSNDWLAELTDAVNQRSYTSTDSRRYIFTFVDADGDMVPESGEVKDFTATADPTWDEAIDPTNYFAYIHAYEPFTPPVLTTNSDFKDMVCRRLRRVVNFIRGEDQGWDTVGAIDLADMRNRKIDYDHDGTVETWRLGDVVYSTPVVVTQPMEDYDLIYHDKGYTDFYTRYLYRRNVLYVGSNDGMVHAFNAGFFDQESNAFLNKPVDKTGNPITSGGPYHTYEIGAELWAYVPYNLLPHLYWLTKSDYGHVYFNDMQPRIFDARIYPDKGPSDPVNPSGWATVMVTGMRFGGGRIAADIDKSDGAYKPDVDKSMSSAFAIFDITNPEEPPKLLGEITFPELGFTTCMPGVIPLRALDENDQESTNQWYLVFGSGPISADGSGVNGANTAALLAGTSSQNAVFYAVDLVELAQNKRVVTLTSTGKKAYTAATASDPYYLTQFSEGESLVSKPAAVDWNRDFSADVVYFGLTYGNHTDGWNGKLRRLVLANGTDSSSHTNWTLDSTLLDLTDSPTVKALANGQPIVSSANVGKDGADNHWVYIGTGRFYAQEDKLNVDQQSYYGIMEPYTGSDKASDMKVEVSTDASDPVVAFSELMNVTGIDVYEGGTSLSGYTKTFSELVKDIQDNYSGWRMDFKYKAGERNLGEPVLAGDVLTFTTYVPSDEPCSIGGESQVYALYYLTGTAYTQSIIGLDTSNMSGDDPLVLKNATLGVGMTITPNIHVGREKGSRAYIQTSTGAIKLIEQLNPGEIKSGRVATNPDLDLTCP